MSTNFTPITAEQREQAKINRLEAQEYARNNYKIEYQDHQHWKSLASTYGCKLPAWWAAGTEIKYMRRVAKKASFDINLFVQSTGCSNLKEYAEINPTFTALGLVGTLLEYINEQNTLKLS